MRCERSGELRVRRERAGLQEHAGNDPSAADMTEQMDHLSHAGELRHDEVLHHDGGDEGRQHPPDGTHRSITGAPTVRPALLGDGLAFTHRAATSAPGRLRRLLIVLERLRQAVNDLGRRLEQRDRDLLEQLGVSEATISRDLKAIFPGAIP